MISFDEVDARASAYQTTGARFSRCVGCSKVGEAMVKRVR